MSINNNDLNEMLNDDRFPRTAKYDLEWLLDNAMGPNPIGLMEWLCEKMDLRPGMRVLDLGCGSAMTSIFLAKEFDVEVWATDLWIKPTENYDRICQAGVQDKVFPVYADALELPYAHNFFDACVSVDAFHYFGTDALYLGKLLPLIKPNAPLGIVCPGLVEEIEGDLPEHIASRIAAWGSPDQFWSFRPADWWQRLWERTTLMTDVEADIMDHGWRYWAQTFRASKAHGAGLLFDHCKADGLQQEIDMLECDQGENIGLVRMVGRRKEAQHGS